MIRPTASGGSLELRDDPEQDRCALCAREEPLRIVVVAGGKLADDPSRPPGAQTAPRLDCAVCATCLCEGLALIFGKRHLQDGGAIGDLSSTPDRKAPPR